MTEAAGRPPSYVSASIEKLQAAADAAATHVGRLYVTFLLFGLYLAITVGATTHEQLLRSAPVELPLLNAQIPLFGFYWIAPFLFVLMHFNLLLHLDLLAQKLWRLDFAIERQLAPDSARQGQRRLLHLFAFSQMLLGRHHRLVIRVLLQVMMWVTVILLPVALLLGVQVRFLPYHDAWTTMWHRGLIAADVLLILVLWVCGIWGRDARAVQKPRGARRDGRASGPAMLGRSLRWATAWPSLAIVTAAPIASLFVLTFPGDPDPDVGDPMEEILFFWHAEMIQEPDLWGCMEVRTTTFWPTVIVFNYLPFLTRTLTVRETSLVASWPSKRQIEALGEDQAWWNFGRSVNLKGRDLRYGCFFRTTLAHAQLGKAKLHGASFLDANLQGADLERADLRTAALNDANLQGASLHRADLRGAKLRNARLQGAWLRGASLGGADLTEASLQGAILRGAHLQGARLDRATLRGADLSEAHLSYAQLSDTDLRAVDLRQATAWWASLPAQRTRWLYANLADFRVGTFGLDGDAGLERAPRLRPDCYDTTSTLPICNGLHVEWPPPSTDQFERRVACELIDLACSEKSPPSAAEGVARRIVDRKLWHRPHWFEVARALQSSHCTAARGLSDWYRRRLEMIINTRPDLEQAGEDGLMIQKTADSAVRRCLEASVGSAAAARIEER